MPLAEPAGDTAEDWRRDQIQVPTGSSTQESVEKAILETGEKGRSEAAAGEERMRGGFSYNTQDLLQQKVAMGSKGVDGTGQIGPC